MPWTRTITSYRYVEGTPDENGDMTGGYYEPVYEDVYDASGENASTIRTSGSSPGSDVAARTATDAASGTQNVTDPNFWTNLLNKVKVGGSAEQQAGIASLAALFTASGLGNNGQQGVYKGYQGGIPNYVAQRTMNPIPTTTTVPGVGANPATTVPRRPGQGGIDYFSQMQYKNAPVQTAATPTSQTAALTTAAAGGIMHAALGGLTGLGSYSDGGRLLRGPGDGVSDSIPATIGQKQPARLADGEFVIPARIVSEIGNGSTEAGARKLYAMMDRVQKVRKKSFKNVAANTKADKYLPT
jgi:hypothetical protein